MNFATMTELQMLGVIMPVAGLADIAFALYQMRGGDATTRAVGGLMLHMGAALIVVGAVFYFMSDETTALWGGIALGAVIVVTGAVRTISALKQLKAQQGPIE